MHIYFVNVNIFIMAYFLPQRTPLQISKEGQEQEYRKVVGNLHDLAPVIALVLTKNLTVAALNSNPLCVYKVAMTTGFRASQPLLTILLDVVTKRSKTRAFWLVALLVSWFTLSSFVAVGVFYRSQLWLVWCNGSE